VRISRTEDSGATFPATRNLGGGAPYSHTLPSDKTSFNSELAYQGAGDQSANTLALTLTAL